MMPLAIIFLGEANILKDNYANAELCMVKAIELEEDNLDYKLRFCHIKRSARRI